MDANFGSIVSILLSINLGQIKIARNIGLLNFTSGILITFILALFLSTAMHLSIFEIFTKSTTDLTINLGRFFLLSGNALFLIETPYIFRAAGISSKPLIANENFVFKILFGLQFILGIFPIHVSSYGIINRFKYKFKQLSKLGTLLRFANRGSDFVGSNIF